MGARQSNLFVSRGASKQAVSISLRGSAELGRAFTELPFKMQKKVCRSAVTKAARRLAKFAREIMSSFPDEPIDTGLLRKSIGYRVWVPKAGRNANWAVGATIGPRKGFATLVRRRINRRRKSSRTTGRAFSTGAITKAVATGETFYRSEYADPVKYGHLVEKGRRTAVGKTGRKLGTVAGRPFLGYGFLRSKDALIAIMRSEIASGLEREARKLGQASIRVNA